MQRTPFEIPAQMRDAADKSVEQARRAFDQFIDATQKAVAKVEGWPQPCARALPT